MQQTSIMLLSRAISPFDLSSLLLVLCLEIPVRPVNGLSNSTTLNAVTNSTSLNRALGINCRGSSFCPSQDFTSDYTGTMLRIVNGLASCLKSEFNCGPLNDTDIYKSNAHIVCLPLGKSFLGGICAFTQRNLNPLGVLGTVIKRKLTQLHDHGCHICGSVPLGDGNDPAEAGILTVNYVNGVVCPGLCPATHYWADGSVETS